MNFKFKSLIRNANWLFVGVAMAVGASSSAHATVVDFDSLSNGTLVTNQFAAQGITFSSSGGKAIFITTQPSYNSTKPNFICTGPANGGLDCNGTVIFNFSAPVNGLTFDAVGNQSAIGTSFAKADIYQNGILTVSNFDLFVSQGNFNADFQDLSAFSNITQLLIHSNTDPAGTGYDTISFNVANAVPEPASIALLGLGLVGMAASRRRKTA